MHLTVFLKYRLVRGLIQRTRVVHLRIRASAHFLSENAPAGNCRLAASQLDLLKTLPRRARARSDVGAGCGAAWCSPTHCKG